MTRRAFLTLINLLQKHGNEMPECGLCSGPADVQEIPYMECFICNRKSLRGAGNYIRKKAAFIDSLQLIVSRRGIDQIRCRFDCKFG